MSESVIDCSASGLDDQKIVDNSFIETGMGGVASTSLAINENQLFATAGTGKNGIELYTKNGAAGPIAIS